MRLNRKHNSKLKRRYQSKGYKFSENSNIDGPCLSRCRQYVSKEGRVHLKLKSSGKGYLILVTKCDIRGEDGV